MAELEETNQRQEHLIAEMHHALYGKKSEKLNDDDRQLAFEGLEVALAEVEEKKSEQALGDDKFRCKKRSPSAIAVTYPRDCRASNR